MFAAQAVETPASQGPSATDRSPHAAKSWWRLLRRVPWRGLVVLLICGLSIQHYGEMLDAAYKVKDWAFWPIALMWGYNAVFFAACFSLGIRVVTWLRVGGTALEQFVFALPTGVIGFTLCMYGLGALHLFNRPAAIALAVLLLLSGAHPGIRFLRRALSQWTTPAARPDAATARLIQAGALAFGVVCLALLYLPVLTQETLNFDAQWCHLTVAQDYAREGHIVRYDGDYARNHPQLAPFIHTWFWLLPVPSLLQRWTLPLHTEFFMVVFALPGIAAVVRYLLKQKAAPMSWVGYFLFPAIFVYDNNLGGSSDHFFMLFTAPLFLAVARAATTLDRRYLLLTGMMAAGSLLTKYQAIYLLPICAVVVLVGLLIGLAKNLRAAYASGKRGSKLLAAVDARRYLLAPLMAAGVFLTLVSPHFVRNWVFYDNPFYPFLQNVFRSNPTQPDAVYYFREVFQDYNWRPHGTTWEQVSSSLKLLATFSFIPSYYFYRADWPNFGALFTYAAPFVLFVRRPARIWLGILVGLGAVFGWAITFRNERNLQGFVPLFAAVTVALLVRAWQLGWFARLGVVLLVALQLVWGGDSLFYSQYGRLTTVINSFRAGYDKTTAQRFTTHPLVEASKTLPPDAKVLFHNNRPTLGLNRVVALDFVGSQALVSYGKVENVAELVGEWQKAGITHVLQETPAWLGKEYRKLEVLFPMLQRAAGPGKRFGGYSLLDIRKLHDLPAQKGMRVVLSGVPGYRDGVYPLASMDVVETLPAHLRHYPPPEAPIPTDPAQQQELVDKASAALITGSPPVQQAMVRKGWSSVQSYSGYFSVYLPPPRPEQKSP